MARHELYLLIFLAAIIIASGSAQAVQGATPRSPVHPASALLARGPAPGPAAPAPTAYDEQLGITFTQDFTSIAYNVTAVAQTDSDGYGPAYLLNGLTDNGYWYQVGLSYDWPYINGGYDPGFNVNYETFDSTKTSIFPSGGGGGLLQLSGPVNNGDNVLLSLYFNSSQVVFSVRDWNTSADASVTYVAQGIMFVGTTSYLDTRGFFTGLMTEWWHVNPYYGTEGEVVYTEAHFALTGAFMWADEWIPGNQVSVLFSNSTHYSFQNPTQVQSFSTHGATEYADAYAFITGALDKVLITLSYSVLGGGVGYSPPVLGYTFDGVLQTATLTGTPTTFFADPGSGWQVSNGLPGGTSTERWETNQETSGSLGSHQVTDLVYFHQFLCTFGFNVVGGGTGYSPPKVQSTQFGSSVSLAGGTPSWVDSGAAYSYDGLLGGSTATERWASMNVSGIVSLPGTIVVPYYHQFGMTLSFSYAGGGSPAAPAITGVRFGRPFSESISNLSIYFLDPRTTWSVQTLLPDSAAEERWVALQGTNGSVSGPAHVTFVYHHQYVYRIGAYPSQGGTTSLSTGWLDAGSSLQLSQSANQGWKFEGWTGSGASSYSGYSNYSSITLNSPIVENATFYPGLQISAGNSGRVTYSFGTQKGSVQAGSTVTVFVPRGTSVALRSSPSSFLYSFSGWSQVAVGTNSTTTVVLDSPATVMATFSLNTTTIGAVTLGVIAIIAAAALTLRGRGRSKS